MHPMIPITAIALLALAACAQGGKVGGTVCADAGQIQTETGKICIQFTEGPDGELVSEGPATSAPRE